MSSETGKEKANQDCSRRDFIKAVTLTVGAASTLSVCKLAPAQSAGKPKGLPSLWPGTIRSYKGDH